MAIRLLHLGLPVGDLQRSMRFYATWFSFDPDGARRYPDGTVILFSRLVWRPAVAELGLEGFRVHDLRHTAGTLAAVAGATTRELMERMGHTTPASLCATSTSWRTVRRHLPSRWMGSPGRLVRSAGFRRSPENAYV